MEGPSLASLEVPSDDAALVGGQGPLCCLCPGRRGCSGRGNLVPCKGRSCFSCGALSAALTPWDKKLFSFEMELGVRMEATDSSIFQKFIVPSINSMTRFGCRLLSLPATGFAVNLCPSSLARGVPYNLVVCIH